MISKVFDIPELQRNPYDLRAVIYHDGMAGTGHYWGYLWVEPAEENLLQDIPNDSGGWFRFCDAIVEPATEQDIYREASCPVMLVYVDRNTPKIPCKLLLNTMPASLHVSAEQSGALIL